jgi:hypothetical protein
VSACPYDIPPHLPPVLMVLADHLHDPQPIAGTVKQVLQDFKRTHQDNWAEHKVRRRRQSFNQFSVADPDPGSGIRCFFTPRIRDPDPGSGMEQWSDPDPGSGIS